jgi:hypothetical protein
MSRDTKGLAEPNTRSVIIGGEIAKRPSKETLSKAGRALQNPRTPEKKESEAAKTLRKGQKK